MVKHYLILIGFVSIVLILAQNTISEANSEAEELYVTTEDIVSDIILPIIEKRVIKEYGGDNELIWNRRGIVDITYNNNHSYDVTVRIDIPSEQLNGNGKEDLIKVRISPSCDSEKINKQICNHEFKLEILEYKHISQ
ncbi:hypothetical protein ACH0B6_18780 [Solibacillus silvestris]